MQRDTNSNRSKKWRIRNSLDNQGCIDYVNKLCTSYGIEKYRIDEFNDGEFGLFIQCKDNIVILSPDLKNMCLQSYRRISKKLNSYFDVPTMHFENDTCWKKGIEWVADQL